jgi:hypothetical protein
MDKPGNWDFNFEELLPLGNVSESQARKKIGMTTIKTTPKYCEKPYRFANDIGDVIPGDIIVSLNTNRTDDQYKCYMMPLRLFQKECEAMYTKALKMLATKEKTLLDDNGYPDVDFIEQFYDNLDEKYELLQEIDKKNKADFTTFLEKFKINPNDYKGEYVKIGQEVDQFKDLFTEKLNALGRLTKDEDRFLLLFVSPRLLVKHMTILGTVVTIDNRDDLKQLVYEISVGVGSEMMCLDHGLDNLDIKDDMHMCMSVSKFYDEIKKRYTYPLIKMILSKNKEAALVPLGELSYVDQYKSQTEFRNYKNFNYPRIRYVAHILKATRQVDLHMIPREIRNIQISDFAVNKNFLGKCYVNISINGGL